jgi:TetR/AcrR family transcriptional regulator, mexJK operon transcriptional repressor
MAGMRGRTIEYNEAPAGKAESILSAAKRTFLASGFGAVSMDTIAREAGVSKATVYAHFAGKEELFGAVIGRECGLYFERFSAGELNPDDVKASLTVLGRRFLDLVLSPDAIALHRIILGEVTRFPGLGEVFWRAGPERQRVQIEAFLQVAASRGTLSVPDTRLAAEQFVSLVRGDIQLRHLLRLEVRAREREIETAVAGAVDTFIRAFERSAEETGASRPAPEVQECARPRGDVTAGPRGRGCPAPSPPFPSNPSTMVSRAAPAARRRRGSRLPAR